MTETKTTLEGDTLTVTRIYGSPIEEVFDAWIETSKIKQWWGCAECTDVRSEVEPRVGGKYNHHMTINNEHDAPSFATLVEYDPPRKLAYRAVEDDGMLVTVNFSAVDGGTLVVLTHAGIPDMRVEGDEELRNIVRAGWTAAFSKLDKLFE